jgi:hypothetical protein
VPHPRLDGSGIVAGVRQGVAAHPGAALRKTWSGRDDALQLRFASASSRLTPAPEFVFVFEFGVGLRLS